MRIIILFFILSFALLAHSAEFKPHLWAPEENLVDLKRRSFQVDWSVALSQKLIINAPIEKIWNYLGDIRNTPQWSVYVSHVRPGLDENKDGSLRRCFRTEDEKTMWWDEMILSQDPGHRRMIYAYALHGYRPQFIGELLRFFVRENYRPIGAGLMELEFAVHVDPDIFWGSDVVFFLMKRRLREALQQNLENIKAIVEGAESMNAYERYPKDLTETLFSQSPAAQPPASKQAP